MQRRALALTGYCLGLMLCIGPTVAMAQAHITLAALGTGASEKYEIVGPTTEFAPNAPMIVCVWKASGVITGTPVRGVWIAEDVGQAAPPNYKIDEVTLHMPAFDEGKFTLTKPNNDWPVGKYRLEIYLGSDLAKTLPFTVKAK